MAVKEGAAHEIAALKRQLMQTEVTNEALCNRLVEAIPTTWLDPLLTGPDAVVTTPPYNCKDIERLLKALKERMQKIVNAQRKEPNHG